MVALMRIKYLEMMLFILVSGATPSISVSSVAPNRALSRSTLLCNLSISTSYWKRRDVALLVTRHTLAGSSVRRQVRETERQRDKKRNDGSGGGNTATAAAAVTAALVAASRAIKEIFVKRGTCYSHNDHVTTYIYVHMLLQ